MRVRITQDTVADRRPVYVGEVVDLSDVDAATLLLMGKAVVVSDAPDVVPDAVVPTVDGKPAAKRRR